MLCENPIGAVEGLVRCNDCIGCARDEIASLREQLAEMKTYAEKATLRIRDVEERAEAAEARVAKRDRALTLCREAFEAEREYGNAIMYEDCERLIAAIDAARETKGES